MAGFPGGQGGRTYGDTSIREDLSDVIFQITPEDTPFASSIGNGRCTSSVHQWQKRSIRTRQFNAKPEGFTYDFTAFTAQFPTRVTNVTQIVANEVRYSETQQSIDHAGINDGFADQMAQEMVGHETSIEHMLLRQTTASGSPSAVPQWRGMIDALVANGSNSYTALGWNNTLTEAMLNQLTAVGYRNGAVFRDVLVGTLLKQTISNFANVNTRFIEADEQRLTRPISVYLGDFEPLTIHRCRDMFDQAVTGTPPSTLTTALGDTGKGNSMLLYDRTACSKDWLRPTHSVRTAYVADSMDGVIKSELTLNWGNENMHLFVSNIQSGV